ncbi:hypothetical protein AXG93_2982s1020 [Marchantia polymorpha subsp. ruderalis]|uniref:Uncharacterized protein n=1 Tax=Marchantia polymorpha subsp. ruderalis TaxID=1480154 RepID=A0A176VZD0_MARPO|nr:hypothetical protein AXG93_2982s1020 [Marchantia polymorpha subsp. ruderalis]
MAKSVPLRMVPLRVPQIGLRAFQDELTAVKLDLLLWGWNWVLRRCAGSEGDLLFDIKSVQLSKEEELTFDGLFKNRRLRKNGYKTRDYVDWKRRNVAVAIFLILQTHKTSYMSSWQERFVKLALAGTSIHWACILWKARRQHAEEEKRGSINHLSPFLINFYRSMGCLTAEEKKQFLLLSRMNPGKFVREVEVDTDLNEVPAITPPGRLRIEEEHRDAQAPRKRKFGEEEEGSPSLEEEEGSIGVLGRSTDLPAPKAHVLLEEACRPSGQRDRLAAMARMPTPEVCVASKQVPFDDAPSAQAPLAQGPSGQVLFKMPSEEAPLALRPSAHIPKDKGRDAGTRVPSAVAPSTEGATELPLAEPELEDLAAPTGVVPLLRYLDRKAAKYGEPRQGKSYVELVRHRTRIKVAANRELIAQDQKYRNLEERYNFLQDQWALARKLQKAGLKLRDEMMANARRAKVQTDSSVQQIQIRNLADELVRKTQALEQSEAARRVDEELLGRLQS